MNPPRVPNLWRVTKKREYPMKKLSLLFLLFMLWGCSAHKPNQIPKQFRKLKNLTVYPVNAKPKDTISFKKNAVYGSTKNILIGQTGPFAVDSSGRVFISGQQNTIYVFKPNGQYLTHFGRKGKGPGEFLSIFNMQIRSNHLYVYDENQLKESVFRLHPLALENTVVLATNRDKFPALKKTFPFIEKLYVRNNNTYLAEFLSSVISRNMHSPQKYPKK